VKFYDQSLTARSWAIPNEEAVKNIFEDAIKGINSRTLQPSTAMNKMGQQLRLLLQ